MASDHHDQSCALVDAELGPGKHVRFTLRARPDETDEAFVERVFVLAQQIDPSVNRKAVRLDDFKGGGWSGGGKGGKPGGGGREKSAPIPGLEFPVVALMRRGWNDLSFLRAYGPVGPDGTAPFADMIGPEKNQWVKANLPNFSTWKLDEKRAIPEGKFPGLIAKVAQAVRKGVTKEGEYDLIGLVMPPAAKPAATPGKKE